MLLRIMGLAAFFVLSTSAFAQTADDCIAEYEDLKLQFEATSLDAALNCVKEGNIISLDAEGPLPASGCGGGEWDHWHLQAKVVGGNEATCTMQLLGLEDRSGCGTEEFSLDLPANEAAKWRKYLREECGL